MVAILRSGLFWSVFAVCIFIVYVMFYFIAYVFESRLPGKDVPIWRNQSKAFIPGDTGLSILVAVGVYYFPKSFLSTNEAILLLTASSSIGVVVFSVARKYLYTPRDYSPEAWKSPTKIWHDVVMFWMFTTAVIFVCVPSYIYIPFSAKVFGLSGLVLWLLGNAWDFTHHEIPNNFQHPTLYMPIWARRR